MRNIGRAAAGLQAPARSRLRQRDRRSNISNAPARTRSWWSRSRSAIPTTPRRRCGCSLRSSWARSLIAVDEDINVARRREHPVGDRLSLAALSRHRDRRSAARSRSIRRRCRPAHRAGSSRATSRRARPRCSSTPRCRGPIRRCRCRSASSWSARSRSGSDLQLPVAQPQRAVVGLFARPLDRGGGAGGRPRRAGPPLRDRREAEAVTPALRRIAVHHAEARHACAEPSKTER